MRCKFPDTDWKFTDKKILKTKEVELIYFFFISKHSIEHDFPCFHELNMGS